MSFQAPVSVSDVLERIHIHDYLLPAIQREFVWSQDQILALLDSLMRGYPIGSFLLWDVKSDSASSYSYYNFITDFHEKTAPFAQKAIVPPGKGIVAVLDGQQRLTALNIALYGSHSERKKGAWINNPDAYPKKFVYLNLLEGPNQEELGLEFDLRFLSEKEAEPQEGEPLKWFKVRDVLALENGGPAIMEALEKRKITSAPSEPFKRLYALYNALRETKSINWYLETDQNPDKVLDIFVRVNSGGTTLSYSDLLLSMATNQWETKDAREEVRSLVVELNTDQNRDFAFTKDNVLKAALVISDLPVRFAVSTFTKENMKIVEDNWETIRSSLVIAASLLKKLGFSARNLAAHSVIVPIAYYLSKVHNANTYADSTHTATDRQLIKNWLARTLIKQGIWGSSLDTLLARLRTTISENAERGFPLKQLEDSMAQIGKTLTFEEAEIDEILSTKYGSSRTFAILSLLYPGLDLSAEFHQDHIFPKSRFTDKKLSELGIEPSHFGDFQEKVDSLPNIQLLQGQANIEKQAALPGDWIETFSSDEAKNQYMVSNDIIGLPLDFESFPVFFQERELRMKAKLKSLLAQ